VAEAPCRRRPRSVLIASLRRLPRSGGGGRRRGGPRPRRRSRPGRLRPGV